MTWNNSHYQFPETPCTDFPLSSSEQEEIVETLRRINRECRIGHFLFDISQGAVWHLKCTVLCFRKEGVSTDGNKMTCYITT